MGAPVSPQGLHGSEAEGGHVTTDPATGWSQRLWRPERVGKPALSHGRSQASPRLGLAQRGPCWTPDLQTRGNEPGGLIWALLGQFQVHSRNRITLFGATDSMICDSGDRKRKQQGKIFFNLYFEISICSLNLHFKKIRWENILIWFLF